MKRLVLILILIFSVSSVFAIPIRGTPGNHTEPHTQNNNFRQGPVKSFTKLDGTKQKVFIGSVVEVDISTIDRWIGDKGVIFRYSTWEAEYFDKSEYSSEVFAEIVKLAREI